MWNTDAGPIHPPADRPVGDAGADVDELTVVLVGESRGQRRDAAAVRLDVYRAGRMRRGLHREGVGILDLDVRARNTVEVAVEDRHTVGT